MFLQNCVLLLLTAFALNADGQACPLKCPSCTKCDAKKGTCTLPRDFVQCTSKTVPGYCYAGMCNTQLTLLPSYRVLNKCQTYRCTGNTCQLYARHNGFDCTPEGQATHSVCMNGVCTPIPIAVTDTFPIRNTGCAGLLDGTHCDTNDLLTDGEKCSGGVCKFSDGSYYGYL